MNAVELKEIGLKTEIARQVGFKKYEIKCGDHTYACLLKTWIAMIGVVPDTKLEDMVWDYFLTTPNKLYIPIESHLVGKYSTIQEYTNAKGRKHMAHFRENGKYIGAVSKLGDKPISYQTSVLLSRDKFTLNVRMLKTATYKDELFEFKTTPTPKPTGKRTGKKMILIKKNGKVVSTIDPDTMPDLPLQ